MSRRILLLVFFLVSVTRGRAVAQSPRRSAAAVDSALRQASVRVHWPGYDPLGTPLAIFDGDSTYLFRHPAPPSRYEATPRGWAVMSGRDTLLSANSSEKLGGVVSATLMIDRATSPFDATAWAAVALHEAFHVFQRTHHRTWVGNEGDLLLYPFEHAQRLALRRLESEALRRAEGASSRDEAWCWTREFVRDRQARYATLDSASRTYERLSELNEGLASYVQVLAAGKRVNPIPPAEFAPEAVRDRAYATGPALGLLLDRFSPEWKSALERNDTQHLDELLDAATRSIVARNPRDAMCDFSPPERAAAAARAVRDSAAIIADRDDARRAFDASSGWRVIVQAADGAPLFPQGFDPSNLAIVRGGLLHRRYLKLGNANGSVEALRSATAAVQSLTTQAGAHPLFNGVRRVEITGIGEPDVREARDSIQITSDGLRLRFTHATVLQDGQRLVLTLHAGG